MKSQKGAAVENMMTQETMTSILPAHLFSPEEETLPLQNSLFFSPCGFALLFYLKNKQTTYSRTVLPQF